jgi:CHASE3 domain sensor protein
MTKMKIGPRILLGFGLALLISGVVSVISYRSTNELLEVADCVTHTHKVLEGISEVRSTMQDAET